MDTAYSLTRFLVSPANLKTSILNRSTSSRGRGVMKAELVSSTLPSTKHLNVGQMGGVGQHPAEPPECGDAVTPPPRLTH